jgi:diacylglycerol kinase
MALHERSPGSWLQKFRCAFRGVTFAFRSQKSFAVHLGVAAAVIAAGVLLRVTLVEWCLLILCIVTVVAAELANTAIEHLARAITDEHDEEIRDALDVTSGAVLLAAIGAAVVGTIVFVHRLGTMLQWWSE